MFGKSRTCLFFRKMTSGISFMISASEITSPQSNNQSSCGNTTPPSPTPPPGFYFGQPIPPPPPLPSPLLPPTRTPSLPPKITRGEDIPPISPLHPEFKTPIKTTSNGKTGGEMTNQGKFSLAIDYVLLTEQNKYAQLENEYIIYHYLLQY